jgi:hypothetical protein
MFIVFLLPLGRDLLYSKQTNVHILIYILYSFSPDCFGLRPRNDAFFWIVTPLSRLAMTQWGCNDGIVFPDCFTASQFAMT